MKTEAGPTVVFKINLHQGSRHCERCIIDPSVSVSDAVHRERAPVLKMSMKWETRKDEVYGR